MNGYFLTIDADEELQDIFLFTQAKWNTAQAEKYLFDLYDTFEIIVDAPGIGRRRRDLAIDDESYPTLTIYSHPCGKHMVFYTEWQGEIGILRVLHQSRDFQAAFNAYNPAPQLAKR